MKTDLKKLRLSQETIKNMTTESTKSKPFVTSTPPFSCGGPHCEHTNAINCHTGVNGR